MFDMSWNGGGITIGWGGDSGGYGTYNPPVYAGGAPYPIYQQQTTISTGMLLVGALVLYLLLKK